MELISENRAFGGRHLRYEHEASTTQCKMTFAVYLPPFASADKPVPVLYWLSGLTCTDQNFMQKAGAMKLASELGYGPLSLLIPVHGEIISLTTTMGRMTLALAQASMLMRHKPLGILTTKCTVMSQKSYHSLWRPICR